MRVWLQLVWREACGHLRDGTTATWCAALLLANGLMFWLLCLGEDGALAADVLDNTLFCMSGSVMVAAVVRGAQSIAQERQLGTWPLWLTARTSAWTLAVAKLAAGFCELWGAQLLCLLFPASLALDGALDGPHLAVGTVGLSLLMLAVLSLGCLASAVAESLWGALLLATTLTAGLTACWLVAAVAPWPALRPLRCLALHHQHFRPLGAGILSTGSLAYYLSLTLLCLGLAADAIAGQRPRPGGRRRARWRQLAPPVVCVVAWAAAQPSLDALPGRWDLAGAGGRLPSAQTRRLVAQTASVAPVRAQLTLQAGSEAEQTVRRYLEALERAAPQALSLAVEAPGSDRAPPGRLLLQAGARHEALAIGRHATVTGQRLRHLDADVFAAWARLMRPLPAVAIAGELETLARTHALRALLQRAGLEALPWEMVPKRPATEAPQVLIDLSPAEVPAVGELATRRAWLAGGGRLLVAALPSQPAAAAPLAALGGLRLGPCGPAAAAATLLPSGARLLRAPAGLTLQEGGEAACPLTVQPIDGTAQAPGPWHREALLQEARGGWTAMASWLGEAAPDAPGGRMVVTGNSDWLLDEGLGRGDNARLALVLIGWLAGAEPARLTPPAAAAAPARHHLQRDGLWLLPCLVLPLALAAAGRWLSRRARLR